MESVENPQMTLEVSTVRDIRQSNEWGKYLARMGWRSEKTQHGINIELRPSIFGSLVKIQKPRPLTKIDFEEIEKIAFEHKVGLIKIEPYVGQDEKLFQNFGYQISNSPLTPTATYLVDLTQSEEHLWNNLSHSAKYSITRAKREGVKIEISRKPSDEQLQNFYKILQLTGKRKKFFIPSINFTMEQARAFGYNGFLFTAYNAAGDICSEKWHVGNGEFVLYVSGGTTPLGLADKSGYLLVWQSILYFKSLGYKVLDLEGKYDKRFPLQTKHWGGFSKFKEKFGSIPVDFPMPRVKYVNPFLKLMGKIAVFSL